MKRIDVVTKSWNEYELIDSGDLRRLERFGEIILDRPDPQAIWQKHTPSLWEGATARFAWNKEEKWSGTPPQMWNISFDKVTLQLSIGSFKHIGIFPEHAVQWEELRTLCKEHPNLRVLNLFGYTGAASLVAAAHGAQVTHVDASKQTIGTVKTNIALSTLPENAVRLVVEDALKYVKRLAQREESFDVIILDPPAFGRGPKGEVWKIEEKLQELVAVLPQIFSKKGKMILINGYAAGFAARSIAELLGQTFASEEGEIIYGDIGILQKGSEHVLPTSIYAKWVRK